MTQLYDSKLHKIININSKIEMHNEKKNFNAGVITKQNSFNDKMSPQSLKFKKKLVFYNQV